jgi:hypothetical protein
MLFSLDMDDLLADGKPEKPPNAKYISHGSFDLRDLGFRQLALLPVPEARIREHSQIPLAIRFEITRHIANQIAGLVAQRFFPSPTHDIRMAIHVS